MSAMARCVKSRSCSCNMKRAMILLHDEGRKKSVSREILLSMDFAYTVNLL